MKRRRISRDEAIRITRILGRCVLACAALADGATPAELVHAAECAEALVGAVRDALRDAEDVPEDGGPTDG